MPYPAGSIGVDDARLQDISGGMQWNMQDANDIRFLAVSGTVTVGPSRARYGLHAGRILPVHRWSTMAHFLHPQ